MSTIIREQPIFMSTKVVWNIDYTVKPLILAVFMKISKVRSLSNGVVMSFVMNIGDDLH